MSKEIENIEFSICKDRNMVKSILNLSEKLLFTPQMFQSSDSSAKAAFSRDGFVIGQHTISSLEKWMMDSKNAIVVVHSINSTINKKTLIGFALVLSDKATIQKVQNYAKDVNFSDSKARNIIDTGKFAYLLQIGIKSEVQNQSIGSRLFDYIFANIQKAIISFVILDPISNQPSLYTHFKNGFTFFGYYTGPYSSFNNYRSVGFIHYPIAMEKKPSKEEILQQLNRIEGWQKTYD